MCKKDVPIEIPWVPEEGLFQRHCGEGVGHKRHSWQGRRGQLKKAVFTISPLRAPKCPGPVVALLNFLFTGPFLALSNHLMMLLMMMMMELLLLLLIIISSPQTVCAKVKGCGISEQVMGRGPGQS